jgi:hypothetical protein
MRNTYCVIEKYDCEEPKQWVVNGFVRFYENDDLNAIKILLGMQYGLILRKLSYDNMHTIVERVTDNVIRYRESVKFCVAALEN